MTYVPSIFLCIAVRGVALLSICALAAEFVLAIVLRREK